MIRSLLSFNLRKVAILVLACTFVLGNVLAPTKAKALETAPGACDTFTQDADYILGNPPPAAIWQPTNGNWIIANDGGEDVLHQNDDAAANPNDALNLLVGPGDFDDFAFQSMIKPLTGNKDVGIIFRAEDNLNYYLFRVDGTAGTAGLFKRENGTYSLLAPETPFVIFANSWYKFHVVAVGSNIRAYIDDVLVSSATDSTFDAGMLGIRTNASTAYFDDTCVGFGPFTWDVDDDGVECSNPDFNQIQEAIDFAAVGDKIHVCAGTYSEQLTINKQITVSGDGASSIIQYPLSVRPLDPARLITMVTLDDTQTDPLVWVEGADNVTLEKLMFDGNEDLVTDGSATSVGIVYKNAKGAIQDSTITNFQDPDCLSCDTGYGVWNEPANSDLLSKNNQFSQIQKNHITSKFGQMKAMDNTLIGQGPVATTDQHGIEFSEGAGGIILNNKVSGFNFTPALAESTGIVIVNGADDITLSGNTLSGNEIGVAIFDTNKGKLVSSVVSGSIHADMYLGDATNWLVTQNKLNNSLDKGLILSNVSNSQISLNTLNAPAGDGVTLQAMNGGSSNNNQFIQNTLTGVKGDGINLAMDNSAGVASMGNSFTSNTLQTGLGNGFIFNAPGAKRFQNTTLRANTIKDNKNNGISIERSTNATLEANTVTGNKLQGILLGALVNGTNVRANTVKANKRHGIALTGNSDNNKFMFNTAKTNGNGITYYDLFWDQNAGATGNSAMLNFYSTKKPAFFWN